MAAQAHLKLGEVSAESGLNKCAALHIIIVFSLMQWAWGCVDGSVFAAVLNFCQDKVCEQLEISLVRICVPNTWLQHS